MPRYNITMDNQAYKILKEAMEKKGFDSFSKTVRYYARKGLNYEFFVENYKGNKEIFPRIEENNRIVEKKDKKTGKT